MKELRPKYPRWINGIDILVPAFDYNSASAIVSSIKSDTEINIYQSFKDQFSREDLVLFTLLKLYDNLILGQTPESCVTLFSDIKYLASLEGGIDTGIVWKDAILYRKEFQVTLVSKVISTALPGIFPDQWPESRLTGRILKKRLVDFLFQRDVINNKSKNGFLHRIIKEGTRRGLIPSVLKHFIWYLVSELGL